MEMRTSFQEFLKYQFDTISPGTFASKLPEIDSIGIIPAFGRIHITIHHTTKYGKPVQTPWIMDENGVFTGNMPRGISLPRAKIEEEIKDIIKRVNFPFWRKTDIEIVPYEDVGPKQGIRGESGEMKKRRCIDPARLTFLEQQKGVLFGFLNKRDGFDKYRVAVFAGRKNIFCVMENPQIENAAFIFDTNGHEKFDPNIFRLPSAQRCTPEESQRIIDQHCKPLLELVETRKDLVDKIGAKRIIHTPNTWQQKLQAEIDARM